MSDNWLAEKSPIFSFLNMSLHFQIIKVLNMNILQTLKDKRYNLGQIYHKFLNTGWLRNKQIKKQTSHYKRELVTILEWHIMIFHYLPFAIENANLFNFQAGLSKYDILYYKRKILVDSLLVQGPVLCTALSELAG